MSPRGVHRIAARVHWNERGVHQAAITVNGEVACSQTYDGNQIVLDVLATIDPDKDIVEVVAHGATQVSGPVASTIGKPVKLIGGEGD